MGMLGLDSSGEVEFVGKATMELVVLSRILVKHQPKLELCMHITICGQLKHHYCMQRKL